MPGTSEATVTARTATSVLTVSREDCHSLASTLVEVTDSGGIAKDLPALIIVAIWPPLIAARTRITPTKATIARIHTRRLFSRPECCCWETAISTMPSLLGCPTRPFLMQEYRAVMLHRGAGGRCDVPPRKTFRAAIPMPNVVARPEFRGESKHDWILARRRSSARPGGAQRLLGGGGARLGEGAPDAPQRAGAAGFRGRAAGEEAGRAPRRVPLGDAARDHHRLARPGLDRRARVRPPHRACGEARRIRARGQGRDRRRALVPPDHFPAHRVRRAGPEEPRHPAPGRDCARGLGADARVPGAVPSGDLGAERARLRRPAPGRTAHGAGGGIGPQRGRAPADRRRHAVAEGGVGRLPR